MTRRAWIALLGVMGLAAFAACSGDGGTDPDRCFVDRGELRDLQASAGTTPAFSWCGFPPSALVVRTAAGGAERWRVECASGEGCLLPPVTYGVVPPNTNERVPDQPLAAGVAVEFCLVPGDVAGDPVCAGFTP